LANPSISAFIAPVPRHCRIRADHFSPSLLAVVLVLSAALLGPAAASAATFTVDTVGDAPKAAVGASCEDSGGKCTLRAAIEAADQKPDFDTIAFDGAEFTGDPGGTIRPGSALPAITGPTTLDGQCPPRQFGDFPYGTCVGLDAGGLSQGLLVEADEVTIRGMAITGAVVGIQVGNSADEFAARNDVLGANLNGEAGPNGTGILLGPGADEAEIGTYAGNGTSGHDEFVDNTGVGLDLEGASHAVIQDDDFGATPAPNGIDIEITDISVGGRVIKAVENEIGAKKSSFAEKTSGCSENCNVISGAVHDGIDLQGGGGDELPASGPTVIRGNVIGATPSGEAAEANGDTGIAVGSAREVTIGGPLATSEGNQFVGGHWAVTAGPEETDLKIEGNSVGRSAAKYPQVLEPPTEGAISLDTQNRAAVDTRPAVVGNDVWMDGGIGVLDSDMGAWIAENFIGGTDTAIQVDGERMWWGAVIEGNEIEYPGEYGIVLDNWSNQVTGNFIFGASKAGVLVESPGWTGGTEDVIGGEGEEIGGEEWSEEWLRRQEEKAVEHEEEENEIDDSGGPAIEIVGEHTAFVDALRNFGKGNGGPFVDLGGDGPGNLPDGPNRGIQAPTIVSATQAEVSGVGALPGGTRVMVFAKASSSRGEIEEFLGSAVHDEDGHWSMAMPEGLPVGMAIAVSQVSGERGSSELAFGTLGPGPEAVPPAKGRDEEESGGGDTPGPGSEVPGSTPRTHAPRVPTTAPSTPKPAAAPSVHITSGPPGSSAQTHVQFKFAASAGSEASFECKLDGAKWAKCRSPKTLKGLKPGKHTFRVRAKASGLTGPVTKYQFTIKG
jgi:CSLREA domain-containing protein